MAASKDAILEAISKMTVLEVVELISDMEKKFGVSAAAPVAFAPGPGGAAPGGAAARVVKDFAKANEKLVPTLVSIGGQVLSGKDLEKVASLPTREQALSQLLGLLKAPIEKLARTLAEPQAKLVRTIAAVRDQKQAAGV